MRLVFFALMLLPQLLVAQIVQDPAADFLRHYDASQTEDLIQTERDLNGDGVPEILLSLTSMHNGVQGNIWILYRSRAAGGYDRIESTSNGGIIEFHRRAASAQERQDREGSDIVRYSAGGGGSGYITSYAMTDDGIEETVIQQINPRAVEADAEIYDTLFNDPATRLQYEIQSVADFENRMEVRIQQIDSRAFPEVTLFATVTQGANPITGLTVDQFFISEDNIVVDASAAKRTEEPIDVSFYIEEGLTVDPGPKFARAAVLEFAPGELNAAFAENPPLEGRRAWVVISANRTNADGKALMRLLESNTPVFTIAAGPNADVGVLRSLAMSTGGRFYGGDPNAAIESIDQQLQEQYEIRYKTRAPLSSEAVREVKLDYRSTSSKPYGTAPGGLTDAQKQELARMSGLRELAEAHNLDSLDSLVVGDTAPPTEMPMIVISDTKVDRTVVADGAEVIVSGLECRIRVIGRCPKLSVSGHLNTIQAEGVESVVVSGANNLIQLHQLKSARLTGDRNELRWERSLTGEAPTVSLPGNQNQVIQDENP